MKKIFDNKFNVGMIILNGIMSIFASMVFLINFEISKGIFFKNDNVIYKFLVEFHNSINNFNVSYFLLFIFIFYFFWNMYFVKKTDKSKKIFSIWLSVILVFITIIGRSLAIDNSLNTIFYNNVQIFKAILLFIGYFLLYLACILGLLSIDFSSFNGKKEDGKILSFFKKHHILISMLLIFISWLPIIIIYFPGTTTGDTLDSLAQFFNIREMSWSARDIVLVDENVIINKHHPVLFTFLLGSIVKIGFIISSYRLGFFFFVMLQVFVSLLVFSLVIHNLIKFKMPNWIIIISLLFFMMCPIISSYVVTIIKDIYGALLILIYNLYLLYIVRNYNDFIKSKLSIIGFMLTILLIFMIKNNSFFILLLSYGGLFLLFWRNKRVLKKVAIIFIIPLLVFLLYDRIILESFHVTGTNSKEKYSIPFMQIARLANRKDDRIDDKDKKVIDKVLDYNTIKNDYYPALADPVKNTYKKNVSDEELKDFWKVYWKYFKKYPTDYILAFFNSTYGYFFPEAGETHGIRFVGIHMGGKNATIIVNGISKYINSRSIIEEIYDIFENVPFFFIFNHVAFYDWFLIFSFIYIIIKKKFNYLIPLISLIAVLLSCLISPVNGSFRYILSIVFCIPMIICINYLVYNESKVTNKRI